MAVASCLHPWQSSLLFVLPWLVFIDQTLAMVLRESLLDTDRCLFVSRPLPRFELLDCGVPGPPDMNFGPWLLLSRTPPRSWLGVYG
jgi:hypothetical protein